MRKAFNHIICLDLRNYLLKILGGVFILGFISCEADVKPSEFRLSGKLDNLTDSHFFAVRESDNPSVDTILVDENGRFSYTSTIDTLTIISLYFNKNTKTTFLIADKGLKVELVGDVTYPDLVEVSGGEINNDLTAFRQENKGLLEQRNTILRSIESGANQDSLIAINIGELRNINFDLSNRAEEYVKMNPSKIASTILIYTFFKDEAFIPRLDDCLGMLRGKAALFPLTMKLKNFSEKVKASKVGSAAPNITLRNLKGKYVNLYDLRGKYVFVLFGSTICDVCIEEQNEARIVYKDLKKKKKNIEFLTVVIKTEERPVSKNIADTVKWQILPDMGGWGAKSLDSYLVRGLPYNVLISPTGIILERDLPVVKLEGKLEEYLSKDLK